MKTQSSLSYAQLARKLKRPASTINDWCKGKHLPYQRDNDDFERLLRLLGVSDLERSGWMRWLNDLRVASANPPVIDNPYRGLASYTEADEPLYFGRSRLAVSLMEHVRSAGQHRPPTPTIVLGPSGSGKTSLVRAGLIARLPDDEAGWSYLHPFDGADAIGVVSSNTRNSTGRPHLVIIDQFEELFSPPDPMRGGPTEADAFLTVVEEIGRRDDLQLVVAARSDFFEEIASVPALSEGIAAGPIVIGPPDSASIDDVVHGPAERAGLTIEPRLNAEIAREFLQPGNRVDRAAILPLLSHVLWLLAETPDDGVLTYEGYVELGGIRNALARSAEDAFATLMASGGEQEVRDLFVQLVEMSTAGRPTRRHVPLAQARSGRTGDGSRAIDEFVARRLLTVDLDVVCITHESLIDAWPRLQEWIDEARSDLLAAQRIRHAADLWVELGEHRDGLLRGSLLDAAIRARDLPTMRTQLEPLHRRFVDLSDAARSEDEANDAAMLSRQLAMQSTITWGSEPSVAAQVAIAAFRTSPTPEATSVLLAATESLPGPRTVVDAGYFRTFVDGSGRLIIANSPARRATVLGDDNVRAEHALGGPSFEFRCAALLGHHLVAGAADGALLTLDVDSGTTEQVKIDGASGPVRGLATDASLRSGRAIGVVGDRLVDIDPVDGTGRAIAGWESSGDHVVSLTIAGRTIGVGCHSGTVHLLHLSGERSVARHGSFRASSTPAGAVLLLPGDPSVLIAGFYDGSVTRFDVTEGTDWAAADAIRVTDTPCASWINCLAVSHDGDLLAAASSDGSVRLWATADWNEVAAPIRHPSVVTDVAVTAASVITACEDGIVRTWSRPDQRRWSDESTATIWSLSMTDDASRLLSSSRAATRSWDIAERQDLRNSIEVLVADTESDFVAGTSCMTADGRTVVIGGRHGELMVVSLDEHSRPTARSSLETTMTELVESVMLSPEGGLLVATDRSGVVEVWRRTEDPAGFTSVSRATIQAPALGVAVSSDGKVCAVSESGDATIWTLDGFVLGEPTTWSTGESFAMCVAFHPWLPLVAVGNADRSVSLWSISTDGQPGVAEVARLTGPSGHVMTVAFNADGTRLGAGSTDGRLWLWDVSNPRCPVEVAAVPSGENGVYAIAFSSDDRQVFTAGPHERIHRWPLDPDDAINLILRKCGDLLTPEEWARLIPERVPYADLRATPT